MPKVTIWIRVEDEEKWNSIPDKPRWLHTAINQPWQFDAFGNLKVLGTDSHPSTSARIVQPEPRVEPDEGSV